MENNQNRFILKDFFAEIGGHLRSALPFAKEVFVFGSSLSVDSPGDFDIVVIVPDDVNLFDVSISIAPIVARLTVGSGVLVSCFPIKVSRYEGGGSQFIRNVRKYGQRI